MKSVQSHSEMQLHITGVRHARISLRRIARQVGHRHSTIRGVGTEYKLTNGDQDQSRYGVSV